MNFGYMWKKVLNRNEGFSLIEILVSMGITSISILAIFSMNNKMLFNNEKTDVLGEIKNQLFSATKDICAWNNTFQDADNNVDNLTQLNCIKNSDNCFGKTGIIQFKSSADAIIGNGNVANEGFDMDGVECFTFDETNGNDDCPYKINVTWNAVCESDPCPNPQIKIISEFIYAPATEVNSIINLDKYKLTTYLPFGQNFNSCTEVYEAGYKTSGYYYVDIDGAGTGCPQKLYCDFKDASSNQIFALLINAFKTGYTSIPIVKELSPDIVGRLSDDVINKLLIKIAGSADNNVKTHVTKSSGQNYIFANRVPTFGLAPTDADRYRENSDSSLCSGYVAAPKDFNHDPASTNFEFYRRIGGKEIGFSDTSDTGNYKGFYCKDGGGAGPCGITAGTCDAKSLPGSVWVKF